MQYYLICISALAAISFAKKDNFARQVGDQLTVRLLVPGTSITHTFSQSEIAQEGTVDRVAADGLWNGVKLDLGPDVLDKDVRCRIFADASASEESVIRVDRGNNKNKDTFSAGDAWAFPNNAEIFVKVVRCPAVEGVF